MKLHQCEVINFGSYKSLRFDFADQGLALIYGKTGSGKSTIPDVAAWMLYGVTAKDGNADDVVSWFSNNEPTRGVLYVQLSQSNEVIEIHRERGPKNDLFWIESNGSPDPIRGSSLMDTQRLLTERLGVSKEDFLMGAYFHEFSESGTFFTANAKSQRELLARIANTERADSLAIKSSKARSTAKSDLSVAESSLSKIQGKLEQIEASKESTKEYLENWEKERQEKIADLIAKCYNFEILKKSKLEALNTKFHVFESVRAKRLNDILTRYTRAEDSLIEASYKPAAPKCPTCKGPNPEVVEYDKIKAHNEAVLEKMAALKEQGCSIESEDNQYQVQIDSALQLENTSLQLVEEEKQKKNPFFTQLRKTTIAFKAATEEFNQAYALVVEKTCAIADYGKLYDLSYALRGELLKNAVRQIEGQTNQYLEKYFDSEIRVQFCLEGSDDLEVRIQKSGYSCNFRQLSKGQRRLLTLCFSLSVMQATENRSGTNFDSVFLDEPTDGMDAELKVKAFALLQELSKAHPTVLVIEHSPELQSMFSSKYHVTMDSDVSDIEADYDA